MGEQPVFDWETVEKWRDALPELVEKVMVENGGNWKGRVVNGGLLIAFQKTIAVAENERKERADLRRQLEEARATTLEIMTELTKAGYQFTHEGEEPVIECCDCELPLAEGHADDCNRPR